MVICLPLQFMPCAQFHKVQSLVRDYFYSTQRILQKWPALDQIQRVLLTVLNNSSRQSCLVSTTVQQHNSDFLGEMRYINPRFTYLFTYLHFLDISIEQRINRESKKYKIAWKSHQNAPICNILYWNLKKKFSGEGAQPPNSLDSHTYFSVIRPLAISGSLDGGAVACNPCVNWAFLFVIVIRLLPDTSSYSYLRMDWVESNDLGGWIARRSCTADRLSLCR